MLSMTAGQQNNVEQKAGPYRKEVSQKGFLVHTNTLEKFLSKIFFNAETENY